VIAGLVRSIPLELNEQDSDRGKRFRKELNVRGTGISQLLKGSGECDVNDLMKTLLEDPKSLDDMFLSSVEHTRKNREMFEKITSRHKKLITSLEKGTAWEVAVAADEASLVDYAKAATAMGEKQWVQQGNEWMVALATEFFKCGGAKRHFLKSKKVQYFSEHGEHMPSEQYSSLSSTLQEDVSGDQKLRLLDVGSCYNPIRHHGNTFDVTAIDLCPEHESVYTCDFLVLEVGLGGNNSKPVYTPCNSKGGIVSAGETVNANFRIHQLPAESFDVITMSLVLSYLPSHLQRSAMIEKARELLARRATQHSHRVGLLLIIEKESCLRSSVNYWKQAICNTGFELYRYEVLISEKKKAHAFAFAKVEHVNVAGTAKLVIKGEIS